MPGRSIFTCEQFEEFARRGVLCVPALFSAEYVEHRLARLGLWKDGTWNRDARARPVWPDTGLKSSKAIGNKHAHVELLLEEPALHGAVETLLDGHAFDRTVYRRPPVFQSIEGPEDRAWWLGRVGAVDDVPLEVMELTGSAGDACFMDLRVLHATAPNASSHRA